MEDVQQWKCVDCNTRRAWGNGEPEMDPSIPLATLKSAVTLLVCSSCNRGRMDIIHSRHTYVGTKVARGVWSQDEYGRSSNGKPVEGNTFHKQTGNWGKARDLLGRV
jgi:hypothetical protein